MSFVKKLVQLLGDVSRIELFARQTSHGFDVWGNQCEDPAVQLHLGYALYIAGLTNAFSNAPLSPTDNQGGGSVQHEQGITSRFKEMP